MLFSTLLVIHILAGSSALIGATGAIATKLLDLNHKLHILSGRIFFIGMALVFLTTLPMTIIRPNLFLFLIGIFSFYLAWTGWRSAVNRSGKPGIQDYFATLIMGVTSAVMICWVGWLSYSGSGDGVTLLVFGTIGGLLTLKENRVYKRGPLRGKERIRAHLASMMAATIAATTAFLVVNVETDPVWIAWLLPTLIISPFIVWMSRRMIPKRTEQ